MQRWCYVVSTTSKLCSCPGCSCGLLTGRVFGLAYGRVTFAPGVCMQQGENAGSWVHASVAAEWYSGRGRPCHSVAVQHAGSCTHRIRLSPSMAVISAILQTHGLMHDDADLASRQHHMLKPPSPSSAEGLRKPVLSSIVQAFPRGFTEAWP